MSARFQVATVRGFPIPRRPTARLSGRSREGLSASVCDTLHGWRVLKTYRSEHARPIPTGGKVALGIDGALRAAEDHARYLNDTYGGW